MRLDGLITALIDICPQSTAELKFGIEQPDEFQRDLIEDLPAVLGPRCANVKSVRYIASIEYKSVTPVMAKFYIETTVRIDFKIKVTVSAIRHEEKLKAAVLINRGERSSEFCANLFFNCA